MLECAIYPITYRGEGILATVVKIAILVAQIVKSVFKCVQNL